VSFSTKINNLRDENKKLGRGLKQWKYQATAESNYDKSLTKNGVILGFLIRHCNTSYRRAQWQQTVSEVAFCNILRY